MPAPASQSFSAAILGAVIAGGQWYRGTVPRATVDSRRAANKRARVARRAARR